MRQTALWQQPTKRFRSTWVFDGMLHRLLGEGYNNGKAMNYLDANWPIADANRLANRVLGLSGFNIICCSYMRPQRWRALKVRNVGEIYRCCCRLPLVVLCLLCRRCCCLDVAADHVIFGGMPFPSQHTAVDGIFILQPTLIDRQWAIFKPQPTAVDGQWAVFKPQSILFDGQWASFKPQSTLIDGQWTVSKP